MKTVQIGTTELDRKLANLSQEASHNEKQTSEPMMVKSWEMILAFISPLGEQFSFPWVFVLILKILHGSVLLPITS